MTPDALPFCQRNIRLWLAVLGVCSLAVLAYSIWLALSRASVHSNHPKAAIGSEPVAAVAAAYASSPGGSRARGWGSERSSAGRGSEAWQGPAWQGASPYGGFAPTPLHSQTDGFTWVARGPAPVAPNVQSSFRQAADLIRPSVVSIQAVRVGAPRGLIGPAAPPLMDPRDGARDRVLGNVPYETIGSGLIVDAAGYVVTNDHLVTGATTFLVTRFQRGNERLQARLVATDPRTDLALLKIDAPGPFAVAEFADSSRVEVGDWVLAVGNPFGFGHTVTAGIISARRATINIGGAQYQGLLQTDAPINQGSSGGPLCNLSGQVVGINTAIYAPTGVWSGAGFAIPSNRVTAFIAARIPAAGSARPALVAGWAAPPYPAAAPLAGTSPWFGVTTVDLTSDLAAKLSLLGGSGAFVTSVAPDSPAEAAEIRRGDVITAVGGLPVSGAAGLQQLMAGLQPGQAVTLTVWRRGVERVTKLRAASAMGN